MCSLLFCVYVYMYNLASKITDSEYIIPALLIPLPCGGEMNAVLCLWVGLW